LTHTPSSKTKKNWDALPKKANRKVNRLNGLVKQVSFYDYDSHWGIFQSVFQGVYCPKGPESNGQSTNKMIDQ